MEIDPGELVDERTAARMLKQLPNTLTTWRCEGRGPKFLKVGRRVFYRLSDIREYLGSLLKDPASNAAANKQAANKKHQFDLAASQAEKRDIRIA